MSSQRIGILAFFLIGLGLFGASAALFRRDRNFVGRSIPTQGKVISVDQVQKPDGTFQFHGAVEWKDRAFHAHRYDVYSDSGGTYVQGQTLALRYDADHLDDVRADGPSYAGLLFGGMGLVFSVIALNSAIRELQSKKNPTA